MPANHTMKAHELARQLRSLPENADVVIAYCQHDGDPFVDVGTLCGIHLASPEEIISDCPVVFLLAHDHSKEPKSV